jgi:hypothetical protein
MVRDPLAAYQEALVAYKEKCIRAYDVALRVHMGSTALQKWWQTAWVADNADKAPQPYDPVRANGEGPAPDDPARLEVDAPQPDEPIRSNAEALFYGGDWPTASDVKAALTALHEAQAAVQAAYELIPARRAIAPPPSPEAIGQTEMARRGL